MEGLLKASKFNFGRMLYGDGSGKLADVINYSLLLASKYDLDIYQIVMDKLRRNAEKYPVEKAKGSAKKYNEL